MRLKTLVNSCFKDASLLAEVDQAFAEWTISCIEHIKEKTAHEIHAVGSHGQTIFHDPQNKYTFQAGCLADIAQTLQGFRASLIFACRMSCLVDKELP
jgi:1,6-anhydro-N-acetylmuramate kinase